MSPKAKSAQNTGASHAQKMIFETADQCDLSLPEWTGATVTVSITKELAENVLSVPVTSLLALLDGGYALEVQESGSITKLVPVKTGIYADGWVEVTGQGLEAGTEVVMPK